MNCKSRAMNPRAAFVRAALLRDIAVLIVVAGAMPDDRSVRIVLRLPHLAIAAPGTGDEPPGAGEYGDRRDDAGESSKYPCDDVHKPPSDSDAMPVPAANPALPAMACLLLDP